ncbi:YopX family protein [Lysinibacillus sp. NPDC048646]|uniref:YopX family protein n=1 Tax=Lysinibacillus sp. NPDC048646 TaxID=3390574 RepID=UPI003CFCA2BF
MREIKFRVYGEIYSYENQMVYLTDDDNLFISSEGKLCEVIQTEGGCHYTEPDHQVLMQFTGIRDKNGREIFEGDIVKYTFIDGEHENTRVVKIYNDGMHFKMYELYRDYWLKKINGVLQVIHGHLTIYKGQTQLLSNITGLVIYSYEVIGNIYENSELLGGDRNGSIKVH